MAAAIAANSVTISSLANLNKKYKVKSATSIFIKRYGKTTSEASKTFQAVIEKTKTKFPQRAKRAPKDAKVPDLSNIYLLKVEEDVDILEAVAEYSNDPNVEYVEPNYIVKVQMIPNDPLYSQQWAHQNTQAELGWDIERGSSNMVIAIVDTGVDYNHEDLVNNIWQDAQGNPGKDFVDINTSAYENAGYELIPEEDYTEIDNEPSDYRGHGTHCAGIAGAVGDNGVGVAGVCHNCRIMPVRAGFSIKYGNNVYGVLETDDIANAITYATDNGGDIISMSFGGSGSQTMKDVVDYAYSEGVVLVAAAGNSHTARRKSYPAGYDNVIAVAATAQDNARAFYSNYGIWVDVAAPGGDWYKDSMILSTVPTTGTLGDPSGYTSLQGTSMAAPYVAGLGGLILSKDNALNSTQVRHILRYGIDIPNSDEYIGTGRVNVYKALQIDIPPQGDAEITFPPDDAFLGSVEIDILGTASGESYNLEIAEDPYSEYWTLIDAGTTVIKGVLGRLDTNGLETGKKYFIRLTVFDNIEITDMVSFFYNKYLHPGWPQSTEAPILSSPTVFDLNNDGKQEIILTTYAKGSNPYGGGYIYVWHEDGTSYEGWPKEISGGTLPGSAAVSDIDNDGFAEIVAAGWGGVYVYNHDGSFKPGWPKNIPTHFSPNLADMDNDGDLEIIIPDHYTKVYAWHHDGTDVLGWPKDVSNPNTAAVADVDQDGSLEIIVGTQGEQGEVYIWHSDGTPLGNWPQKTVGWVNAPPVIGDIDGDGDMEIVVISGSAVYAWHHDGTIVSGWPLAFDSINSYIPPVLADIDKDGDLEILFSRGLIDSKALIEFYHHDASPVSGWPVSIPPSLEGYHSGASQVVVGDIDGDEDMEVVAKAYDRLFAWHHDGTLVKDFPFFVDDQLHLGGTSPFPAIADVDNDGKVEIICSTSFDRVFLFDLQGEFNAEKMEWPMFQHDPQNTGVYGIPERSDISADPASKDFGSVDVGSSVSQTFTISSNGAADLVISGVSLTGSDPDQFSIQNNNCSGATIAPSGNCTVDVVFSPTKEGVLSASLGIDSNNPDTPTLYIGLSGIGFEAIDVANSDYANAAGTVTGSYINTQTQDDTYESIEEISTGGRSSSRYDWADHVWDFTITGNNSVFYIDAYRVDGGDADTGFKFQWSTSPTSGFTDMLTVTNTADNDTYQSYDLGTVSGTIYIRVVDTNHTAGQNLHDTIKIDHMYIIGTGTGNALPIADPNGPYTGAEGQAITLDGSGSSDSDGTITLYEWDIDNNGTYDYSSSSPTQPHTYAQQGIYTIKLRVTDNFGATGEETTTATISDTSPTVDFTGDPTNGTAPLTVNFTSTSTGYDQPLSYNWDCGNGETPTEENPTCTYTSAGTYSVSLTVTDSDGSSDTLTRADYIAVTPPVYTLTVNINGKGIVTSLPAGIDCPGDCTENYDGGAVVTLTATPDSGWNFSSWSGACSGTGDCVVTMDSDKTVAATFTKSINLPQTGQTTCYNELGNVIDCTGTGQDAEISAGVGWPEPRFTLAGDGNCLKDNLTGLIWTLDANLAPDITWQQALDYANDLVLCGYDDWRLPNVNELESLINYGVSNPAQWLTDQGFLNVQTGYYWSSTTYFRYYPPEGVYTSDHAWAVSIRRAGTLIGGYYGAYDAAGVPDKTMADATFSAGALHVWPVRGGVDLYQ